MPNRSTESIVFKIFVKLFVALACISSVAYLVACSYAIARVVPFLKGNKNESERNGSSSGGIHPIVEVSCLGVSVLASLLELISSLSLLFHFGGHVKKHSMRWIVLNSFLLVLLILAYLVPFSFNEHGEHASVHQFWGNAKEAAIQAKENISLEHAVSYAFYANFIVTVVSLVAIGMMCRFVKSQSDYQVVR